MVKGYVPSHSAKKRKSYITRTILFAPEVYIKMNKEVRMLLPKKDLIHLEYIGKINNYYEDIYIPPYNNTD